MNSFDEDLKGLKLGLKRSKKTKEDEKIQKVSNWRETQIDKLRMHKKIQSSAKSNKNSLKIEPEPERND